jgi:hypothetical protein
MRFAHAPVGFNARETGKSFVSLWYPFHVLWQIAMVVLGVKPMKIFGTLGAAFMLIASTIFIFELVQYLMGLSEKPVVQVNLVMGMGLFGLQTIFFGALAQLIIESR